MPQVNKLGFRSSGTEQLGVFWKRAISHSVLVGLLLVSWGISIEVLLAAEELPLSDLEERFGQKVG